MYKVVKVGIPIRTIDISDDFLKIIKDIKMSNSVGISTVSYYPTVHENFSKHTDTMSSIAGHKIIFENLPIVDYTDNLKLNCINSIEYFTTLRNLDKELIAHNIFSFLDEQYSKIKFNNVYMFSTGSPHVLDIFSESLLLHKEVTFVDTVSSIDICKESMFENLGIKPETIFLRYTRDFIKNNNPKLDLNKLNLFGSISDLYKNIEDDTYSLVDEFFKTMDKYVKPNDIFMFSYVDEYGANTFKVPYRDAALCYKYQKHLTNRPFVIGITKEENDNSRTI